MIGINTNMLHGYPVLDPYTGAASIPKYQTSTFDQKPGYLETAKFSYSRFGNPTIYALEEGIKQYEHAQFGFAFSSGMAAIAACLML